MQDLNMNLNMIYITMLLKMITESIITYLIASNHKLFTGKNISVVYKLLAILLHITYSISVCMVSM